MDLDGSMNLRDRRNAANGVTKIYLQSLADKGVQLFRDRDFKGALGFLNQAIEQDSDAPAAVIDKRAATFVKLQKFDEALADAGRIVRNHKGNAIGYLRLAQILQLQSKPEKALKVYGRALRSVPPTDPHFKTLQTSQDQVASRLSPPTASDPLQLLPKELAWILLRYLDFRDIVNISRVCRGWRTYVTTIPSLWQDLDLSTSKRSVPFKTLKTLVKRSQGCVRSFSTPRSCQDIKDQFLYIADRCKTLQDLRFCGSYAGESLIAGVPLMPNLKKLVVAPDSLIMLGNCIEILNKCRQLEVAEFHKITGISSLFDQNPTLPSNLRSLVMVADAKPDASMMWETLKTLPRMQEVTFQHWGLGDFGSDPATDTPGFPELVKIDLRSSQLLGFPTLPPTLRDLSLDKATIAMRADQVLNIGKFQDLVRLSMSGLQIMCDHGAVLRHLLAANKGHLLELDISHTHLSLNELTDLIQGEFLTSVERLALRQCRISDEFASLLGKHCKHLKSLDLAHTGITGVGVKHLMAELRPGLVFLGLDSCKAVSPDAVEWARKQGLKVSFRFPEHMLKGKRVRH